MVKKQIKSVEETQQLGYELGQTVKPGTVIVLTGDLGVGKTTFTQGIGRGLGIKQLVKSPTYTLIREYDDGRLPLYHMDVYRLDGYADDLGLDEYFESDGVCIVEWGTMIQDELPPHYLEIIIKRLDETTREFEFIEH